MKILILNPPHPVAIIREGRCQSPQNMRKNSIPQMTLAYLAGILDREGHEVKVFDCIASDISEEKLFDEISLFKPELALLNTTTPSINADLIFMQNMKGRYPTIITAVFGTHVTILHKEIMESVPLLDIVIRNEPEEIIGDVAAHISRGVVSGEIKGCTVRVEGKVLVGPDQEFQKDLDSFGFPAWKYLPLEHYTHPIFNKPYLMINTGRGCVHKCIFCVASQFYGNKVRFRSVENLIEEIAANINSFGVKHFWFYADDFTYNPEYVKKLCRAIIDAPFNIVWWSNTRVDKLDEEMFSLMKRSGCYMLSIGGESGNREMLKRIKKGTKPEFIKDTVGMLRKVGINSLVYFLIGLPGETRSTIKETVDFAKNINPDYVEFYPATPYPGTEFYESSILENMIVETDWTNYQCGGDEFVVQIAGVPKEELDEILRKAYREFYMRPAYGLALLRRALKPKEFIRLLQFGMSYLRRFVVREA